MIVNIDGAVHRVNSKEKIVEILMSTSMDKVLDVYMKNFSKRAKQFRSQTIRIDSIDTFIYDLNFFGYIKIMEN